CARGRYYGSSSWFAYW
nr:immunoglobulin heavy chain junction region [Mus musculus]